MGRQWDERDQVFVYTWPDPRGLSPDVKKALRALWDACDDLNYRRPCENSPNWDLRWGAGEGRDYEGPRETLKQFKRRSGMSIGICRGCAVLFECAKYADADPDAIGIIGAKIRKGPR